MSAELMSSFFCRMSWALAYLARAEAILIARAAHRHRRLAVKTYVGDQAGARAVERFFQRHGTDPRFDALLHEYVAQRAPPNERAV